MIQAHPLCTCQPAYPVYITLNHAGMVGLTKIINEQGISRKKLLLQKPLTKAHSSPAAPVNNAPFPTLNLQILKNQKSCEEEEDVPEEAEANNPAKSSSDEEPSSHKSSVSVMLPHQIYNEQMRVA